MIRKLRHIRALESDLQADLERMELKESVCDEQADKAETGIEELAAPEQSAAEPAGQEKTGQEGSPAPEPDGAEPGGRGDDDPQVPQESSTIPVEADGCAQEELD